MSRPRMHYRLGRRHASIVIYAYVTPAGEVLYVGRTCDPPTRHGAHRQRSHWWTPDLTFSVIRVVEGWDEGVRAEAEAIHAHRPTFNVIHNQERAS